MKPKMLQFWELEPENLNKTISRHTTWKADKKINKLL